MSVDVDVRPERTEEILKRVESLSERFRSRLPITEAARSIPRDSVEELVDAGLARMLVPAEHGGLNLGLRDAMDVTIAVSRACASTGWISWLMMHVPHVVAMFPAEAQLAVWAAGPDVVTAGSHFGMTISQVPGGYRISGRGPFTSGVNNAEWAYVGGMEPTKAGPPQLRYFLLQKSQYTVQDTWDTVGMRGTGSNTVVVDDVFVPESFTLAHADAREGTSPGAELNSSPLLRQPWVAKGSLGFVASILGAAQAAHGAVVASLTQKKTPSGARVADSEVMQMDIGRTSAQLGAAQTLLYGFADRADSGRQLSAVERAEIGRDSALIVSLSLEALDKLVELSGTSGFGTTSVVQQSWRDAHFAAAHMSLSRRESWARFGRVLLDVADKSPGMFA